MIVLILMSCLSYQFIIEFLFYIKRAFLVVFGVNDNITSRFKRAGKGTNKYHNFENIKFEIDDLLCIFVLLDKILIFLKIHYKLCICVGLSKQDNIVGD